MWSALRLPSTVSLQSETRLSSGGVEGMAPVGQLVGEGDWEGAGQANFINFLLGIQRRDTVKAFHKGKLSYWIVIY